MKLPNDLDARVEAIGVFIGGYRDVLMIRPP